MYLTIDEIDEITKEKYGITFSELKKKLDDANEYLERSFIFDDENGEYYQSHDFDAWNAKELHEIIKEK